jgi:tetratricopeptide (TPR) repeat protein
LIADSRPHEALVAVDPVEDDETTVVRAAALTELGDIAAAAELLATVEPAGYEFHLVRGTVAQQAGRYDEAERDFLQARANAAAAYGANSVEVATAINALGMLFKYSGRFDEGVALYHEALAILGDDHPEAASIYHNLGGLEHARRDFHAADPHARRGVELRRAALGPGHVHVAVDESAWAAILHALGREDEAEELLRRSLPVMEAALGPGHREVAAAWNNLGSVLAGREDYEGADTAYHHALEAKERTAGAESPALAITLNNLGVNARRRGRSREAEQFYRRALDILEGRVDPEHPNLLLTRRNYAKLREDCERQARLATGRPKPKEEP